MSGAGRRSSMQSSAVVTVSWTDVPKFPGAKEGVEMASLSL